MTRPGVGDFARPTGNAQSAGLGHGSEFTVTLPLIVAASSYPTEPVEQVIHATSSLRIMIVDDNVDAAEMLGLSLRIAGHEVVIQHQAVEVIALANAMKPSVFLLDIGMPEMDGNTLAKRLRFEPTTANATLIAITGYGQEEDRKDAIAAGFDYHFVKPINIRELGNLLAELPS